MLKMDGKHLGSRYVNNQQSTPEISHAINAHIAIQPNDNNRILIPIKRITFLIRKLHFTNKSSQNYALPQWKKKYRKLH